MGGGTLADLQLPCDICGRVTVLDAADASNEAVGSAARRTPAKPPDQQAAQHPNGS